MPESKDVTWEAVKRINSALEGGEYLLGETVIRDLELRAILGEERYGARLHTHNGRDPLYDLYEEILDAYVYAVQWDMEEPSDQSDEAFRLVFEVLGPILRALVLRFTDGGFLSHRAPQPAPLFDQPLVRE